MQSSGLAAGRPADHGGSGTAWKAGERATGLHLHRDGCIRTRGCRGCDAPGLRVQTQNVSCFRKKAARSSSGASRMSRTRSKYSSRGAPGQKCSSILAGAPEVFLKPWTPPAGTWTQSPDRKSTRLNSSHLVTSYAVFCLKKKNDPPEHNRNAAHYKPSLIRTLHAMGH